MKLKQAIELLQQIQENSHGRQLKLCIPVFRPGALGGTPCVDVIDINAGFDWDARKVMLTGETQLTTLSPEEVADIRTSVSKGQSWHAYQAHKAMKEKLDAAEARADALQAELDALRATTNTAPT